MKKLISGLIIILLFCTSVPASAVFLPTTEVITAQAHDYLASSDDYSSPTYTEAERRIVSAVENQAKTIDLEGLNLPRSDFSDFYFSVRQDNPQLFYLKGKMSYSINLSDDTVSKAYPEYLTEGSELDEMKKKFNSAVEEALSVIDDNMSDVEKALALHDYLANTAEYDMTVYDETAETPDVSYTAYGVLVNKVGVCQSYSFAYKLLLDLHCGVEVQYCPSDTMNHVWNKVKIGGKYYHVDVTWDDPTSDRLGTVYHSYFLKSDSAFQKHQDYDTATYPCTDTSFDSSMPWNDVRSAMWWNDGKVYYVSSAKALCEYDFSSKASKIIKSIPDTWKAPGSNAYYVNTYSSLSFINGRLYYNLTDRICSVLPDGSDYKQEFQTETNPKYIYGSAYRNGGLYYTYKESPDAKEDIRLAFFIRKDEPKAPDFDLYASALSFPSAVSEGESYTVSATVRNLGDDAVPSGATVEFYVDGRFLCSETINSTIASGKAVNISAGTPSKSSFGSHQVKIIISHEKYDEADSSNNIIKKRLVIL